QQALLLALKDLAEKPSPGLKTRLGARRSVQDVPQADQGDIEAAVVARPRSLAAGCDRCPREHLQALDWKHQIGERLAIAVQFMHPQIGFRGAYPGRLPVASILDADVSGFIGTFPI
ncbi:MAG: hypothetical protein ABW003_17435, partial [Microvirga sp.]